MQIAKQEEFLREKDLIISQLIENKHSMEMHINSKDDEIKDLEVINQHQVSSLT